MNKLEEYIVREEVLTNLNLSVGIFIVVMFAQLISPFSEVSISVGIIATATSFVLLSLFDFFKRYK